MEMSVVASRTSTSGRKEENSGVNRLIALLEEYFVYTSTGQRVVDINVAAGIALAELRIIKKVYGQEAGSSEEPMPKAS